MGLFYDQIELLDKKFIPFPLKENRILASSHCLKAEAGAVGTTVANSSQIPANRSGKH